MPLATTDLQIVQVPIDDLHPDPANPRKISAAELDALTRSLREFGFVQPVIARHEDHIVIGGHQRLVASASRRCRPSSWTSAPSSAIC
jgi:ParB-like chromosome segregation protein Spo0J